jgi:hypothetical protein
MVSSVITSTASRNTLSGRATLGISSS